MKNRKSWVHNENNATKKKCRISDGLGLRNAVVQKPFQRKSAIHTSIVARVKCYLYIQHASWGTQKGHSSKWSNTDEVETRGAPLTSALPQLAWFINLLIDSREGYFAFWIRSVVLLNEIAGFEPSSRPYLLKYDAPCRPDVIVR